MIPRAAFGTIYQLEGYTDPQGVALIEDPSRRRAESDELGMGVGLDARLAGVDWAATLDRAQWREDQFRTRTGQQPIDRWKATATRLAVFAHRRLGIGAEVRGAARWTRLRGDATLGRLDGAVTFRAIESRVDLNGEVRFAVSVVRLGMAFGTSRRAHVRSDFILDRRVSWVAWVPHAALAAAAPITARTSVQLGVAVALRSPIATILDPANRTDAWRRLIAPELGLLATRTRGVAATVALRYTLGRAALWTQASVGRETPWTDARLAFAPGGARVRGRVSGGVVVGR